MRDKSAVSPAGAQGLLRQEPGPLRNIRNRSPSRLFQFSLRSNATPTQLRRGASGRSDALRQAKATKTAEEFGLLAEKISDDDYRVMMGQHKPVPVDQLTPQVLTALRAMKPGDVSDVIQIEQAYTIVRLNEHTPAGKTKFRRREDATRKRAATEQGRTSFAPRSTRS